MKHTAPRQPRPGRTARRGSSVVALILMLTVLTMAVLGAVAASGDEAAVGALRVETARSFYAAESGCVVVIRLSSESRTLPVQGTSLTIPHAQATFDAVPSTGLAGDVVVIGSSGFGHRRVRVTLTAP